MQTLFSPCCLSSVLGAALAVCILLVAASSSAGASGFAPPAPLYAESDPGIVLLDVNNLKSDSTLGSPGPAWLVEFYSSWCGHCIHFAPEFKKLGIEVKSEEKVSHTI